MWLVAVVPGRAATQQATTVYADLGGGVVAVAELTEGASFDRRVIYSIFFTTPADSSELVAIITRSATESENRTVFAVTRRDTLRPTAQEAAVERCRLKDRKVVCRPIEAAFLRFSPDDPWTDLLEIEIPPQRIDWEDEFLRLTMSEGAYVLDGRLSDDGEGGVKLSAAGDSIQRPSPAITQARLPALSELEQQYLVQRPFFRFDASPFVRDQRTGTGGFDDLSLSFEGGVYRPSASGNVLGQLTWSGAVATDAGINFNRLALEAGGAMNLAPRDWLPLTLLAKGEADQDFEAIDLSAEANLAYVLPFNLNLQTGAYRPAAAPWIRIMGAYGTSLERPDSLPADSRGTLNTSEFFRVGWDVRWRIPIGRTALLRLYHAGLWNDPFDADGKWHLLWDVLFEVEVAGMKYFVGYQEGEAAPLFTPIETTRAGLSFAIGEP